MKRRWILYLLLAMVGMVSLAITVYSMVIDNTVARQNVDRAVIEGYSFGYSVAGGEGK